MANDLSFPKIIQVLWQYGLWPIEWQEAVFVFRNPHNNSLFVVSNDADTPITLEMLQEMLNHVGMSENRFWQLYNDTP